MWKIRLLKRVQLGFLLATDQLLSGITYIEIRGTEILDKHFPEDSKEILRIFKETKHAYGDKYSDKFFVTVIHSDGTIREIQ